MAATPKPKKAASAPKRRSAPATERKVAGGVSVGQSESKSEAKSLVQQAYESIKERIINLHFLPGQYLNEAAICAQLKLGRTPVHQALQRLQMEGLVDVLPRKGIIVQPDSLAEIMKILDSRVTVEPELARSAARRVKAGEITADQLKRVMEIATATGR